jgi:hypothetical protein
MINLKDTAIATILVLVFVFCTGSAFLYVINHCEFLYGNNDEIRQCLKI